MSIPNLHPDTRRLADYRAGHLSPSEALGVSDHLADCPTCRAALPPARTAAAGGWKIELPAILPDAPPDYEEMAGLLDGSLDAAQSAETRARLAASPGAAAAFAELQCFCDETAGLPPKRHGPEQPPEVAVHAVIKKLPTPRKLVPLPHFSRASWIAAAAAAVVLFSVGWWLTIGARAARIQPLWADADLSRLPDDLRHNVERVAQTGTVDRPPIRAELSPPLGTLAGSLPKPTTLRQISPVGVVVREDLPVLRWTAAKDATGYVVYLLDVEERAPMLRQEVSGGTTTWTPPAPLARGTTFEWQVEARRGSEVLARAPRPPEPEARFQVLDERHAAELTEVERLYPRNALILGTAYARAGLEEEACRQFEELARRYPKSAVAGRLRREAQAWRQASR